MDYKKLKIEQFNNITFKNFEDKEEVLYDVTDVVVYYIQSVDDIQTCVDYCKAIKMASENRMILVYEKGRKDINRDIIIKPFKDGTYLEFKMKAPMLCSLDKKHSAFVLKKE